MYNKKKKEKKKKKTMIPGQTLEVPHLELVASLKQHYPVTLSVFHPVAIFLSRYPFYSRPISWLLNFIID